MGELSEISHTMENLMQEKIFSILQQCFSDCETWMKQVVLLARRYLNILKNLKIVGPDEIIDSAALIHYTYELFKIICLTNLKIHILSTGEVSRNYQIKNEHKLRLLEIHHELVHSENSPICIATCRSAKQNLGAQFETERSSKRSKHDTAEKVVFALFNFVHLLVYNLIYVRRRLLLLCLKKTFLTVLSNRLRNGLVTRASYCVTSKRF
jgi:hypothetical protein